MNYFAKVCIEQCGLQPGRPVVVGFSGGADSLSLLILLKMAGCPVIAAHFNHNLRVAADEDENAARIAAGKLDVPFVSGAADVNRVSREQKLSVEEAARKCRYQWLFEQAKEFYAQAVAVGHTADDQVETVLMHLLRGAGLDGLSGMNFRQILPIWDMEIPVVRPLLHTWREETESICAQAGITPVLDESNQSMQYFRNRIRLDLIPYLQSYNPQVKPHLLTTARILTEEEKILNQVKEETWQKCFSVRSSQWIALNRAAFSGYELGLRRSVLRRAVMELDPQRRDLDFEATKSLVDFVDSPSRSGEMCLPGGLWVRAEVGDIVIWKGEPGLRGNFPQISDGSEFQLEVNSYVDFSEWRIDLRECDLQTARAAISVDCSPENAWLDAAGLQFPLVIRVSQPGEKFSPYGMGGKNKKLSDFWIDRKIPRQARKNWPVVYSGQSIVWVSGLAISDAAAITGPTRAVVQLSLHYRSRPPAGVV